MQARGKAYEARALRFFRRSVGAGIELQSRKWISYEEPLGRLRAAQPDCFVVLSSRVVVLEIKLTRCLEAFLQIERLYFPLLSELFQLPLSGVCVFRNPGAGFVPLATGPRSLLEALETPAGAISEWHLLV